MWLKVIAAFSGGGSLVNSDFPSYPAHMFASAASVLYLDNKIKVHLRQALEKAITTSGQRTQAKLDNLKLWTKSVLDNLKLSVKLTNYPIPDWRRC